MADDDDNKPVNNSKKPINGYDKLNEIEASRSRLVGNVWEDTKQYADKLEATKAKEGEARQKYNTATAGTDRLVAKKRLENAIARTGFAEERIDTSQDEFFRKVNAGAADAIGVQTKYDNVNAHTTTMSSDQRYSSHIRQNENLLQVPTQAIEQGIINKQKQISSLGTTLAGQTRILGKDTKPTAAMNKNSSKIEELMDEVALDKKTLKVQNKRGMSTEKRQYGIEALLERSDSITGKSTLRQDVAAGKDSKTGEKLGSFEEEVKKLTEMTKKVTAAQGDWQKSLDKMGTAAEDSAEDHADLSDKLEEARKATSIKQDQVDETKRQGKSVGGIGQNIRGVAGILGTVARTASTVALENELEETNQRTTFANMANRQYDNVGKLVKGDMGALQELTKGDAFRKQYSDNMRNRAVGFKGVEAGVTGLDAVGQALIIKGEALTLDPGGGYSAGHNLAGTVGQGVLQTDKLRRETMQGGYAAQASQASLAAFNALTHIQTDGLQTTFNLNKQAYQGAVGMGSKARSGFMNTFTNDKTLLQFADANMTPEEALQTAQLGAQAFGTQENYKDFALKAGKAQMRGSMSKEQYAGATGMLSDVGGGSGDLESIMSAAVTVGMENAKNVNQMVQATSALASGSAAKGFSTVSATEDMISSSIQALRGIGVDKNIATGAAMNAMTSFEDAAGRKGTFADLQYRAKIDETYGGDLNIDQRMILANKTEAEMTTILEGSKAQGVDETDEDFEKRRNAAKVAAGSIKGTIGMNEDGTLSAKGRSRMQKLRQGRREKGVLEELGIRGISDPNIIKELAQYRAGILDAEDVSQGAKEAYEANSGGKLFTSLRAAGAKKGDVNNRTEGKFDNMSGYDPVVKGLQNIKKSDAQYEGKKKQIGDKAMSGDFGGWEGMSQIVTAAVEAGPAAMQTAVAEAAKKLESPGMMFKTGGIAFQAGIKSFLDHLSSLGINADPSNQAGNLKKVKASTTAGSKKAGTNATSASGSF